MKTFNQDKITQRKVGDTVFFRYKPFSRLSFEEATRSIQLTKNFHCFHMIYKFLKKFSKISFLVKHMLENGMYKKDIYKKFDGSNKSEEYLDNIIQENNKSFEEYSKNTIEKFSKNVDESVFKYRVSYEDYKPMTEKDILDSELRDSEYKKQYFLNKS